MNILINASNLKKGDGLLVAFSTFMRMQVLCEMYQNWKW